ncbi:dolichyl-phosphate beta-glucosyltransferase [Patescibacteria group bacterium]
MNEIYLSIIIPAYKEEKGIGNSLLAIDKYLSKQEYSYEIIIVNDGSKDKTAEVVKKFSELVKNIRLIDNKENHGKGYVVRQGLLEAKGRYRLFTDADNSTSIDHLDKVWPFFEKGYEIVIGSRDEKDAKGAGQAVPQSFFKRMLGNMGNVLIQILAVWGIWDTQCGFKILTKEAAEDIFTRCIIDRWGFDIEMLAIAKRLKYKIGIIPAYWVNRADSRVSIWGYLKTFLELFKVKYNLITDKYNLKNTRNGS